MQDLQKDFREGSQVGFFVICSDNNCCRIDRDAKAMHNKISLGGSPGRPRQLSVVAVETIKHSFTRVYETFSSRHDGVVCSHKKRCLCFDCQ